jgi:hypothetical protein
MYGLRRYGTQVLAAVVGAACMNPPGSRADSQCGAFRFAASDPGGFQKSCGDGFHAMQLMEDIQHASFLYDNTRAGRTRRRAGICRWTRRRWHDEQSRQYIFVNQPEQRQPNDAEQSSRCRRQREYPNESRQHGFGCGACGANQR